MASTANGMNLASFGKRAAAWIIDIIIISFPLVVVFAFLSVSYVGRTDMMNNLEGRLELLQWKQALLWIGVGLAWLYSTLFESSFYQATPGKRALGLIVTDGEGNQIDLGRAAGRSLVKFLISNIFGIGYLIALFTEKRQALHDIAAGCLVLEKISAPAPRAFSQCGGSAPPPTPSGLPGEKGGQGGNSSLLAAEQKDPRVCLACGMKNPAAAMFCAKCGRALMIQCPECGSDKSADTEFCAFCGTNSEHFLLLQKTCAEFTHLLRANKWSQIKAAIGSLPQALRINGEKGRGLLQYIADAEKQANSTQKEIEDIRQNVHAWNSDDQRLDEVQKMIKRLLVLEPDCPEASLLPSVEARQSERDRKILIAAADDLHRGFSHFSTRQRSHALNSLNNDIYKYEHDHSSSCSDEIDDLKLLLENLSAQNRRARNKYSIYAAGGFLILVIAGYAGYTMWQSIRLKHQTQWDSKCSAALDIWAKGDSSQSAILLEDLAGKGHAWSQYLLGTYWIQRGDINKAQPWLQSAASQGIAPAIDDLKYIVGTFVRYKRREGYYKDGISIWAHQGNAVAQNIFGDMLAAGRGVPKDETAAVKWYIKAAEQDYLLGQLRLAELYVDGQGSEDIDSAIKWWKRAAEKGDLSTQLRLGSLFTQGTTVSQDYPEAAKWYRKAAEQGNVEGQLALGAIYLGGLGVPVNNVEAEKYLRLSAAQNSIKAKITLGIIYSNDHGSGTNQAEVIDWIRTAALHGIAEAQNKYGELLAEGYGVEKDDNEASEWFLKAAEQTNVQAQYNLGKMHMEGRGPIDSNVDMSFFRSGIMGTEDEYRNMIIHSRHQSEAQKWIEEAAKRGHAAAQAEYGYMNESGIANAHPSKLRGKHWFGKSALQGNAKGQVELGMIFADGWGVQRDETEAFKWFKLAAEQGDPNGQSWLGRMYFEGRGIDGNMQDAAKWFKKAADQNDKWGQYWWGYMLHNGIGVTKSDIEAVKYLKQATNTYNKPAQKVLADIYGASPKATDSKMPWWWEFPDRFIGDKPDAWTRYSNELAETLEPDWLRIAAYGYEGYEAIQRFDEAQMQNYRRLANSGDAAAMARMGVVYADGIGERPDDNVALDWFRKAAIAGNPLGQYGLGRMYAEGRGMVETNNAEAVLWLSKSADQGNASAQLWLGLMYSTG